MTRAAEGPFAGHARAALGWGPPPPRAGRSMS
jgi:hypothetical protein